MMRKNITFDFKIKVILEAIKERKTLEELEVEFDVAPSQIFRWSKEFKENRRSIFIKDKRQLKEWSF